MFNENQIQLLPERICTRLSDINTEFLEIIGKRIKETGEALIPSEVHKLQRLFESGTDVDYITRKLSEASEKNIAEIYDIYNAVAKENYTYSKPFYKAKGIKYIPFDDNEPLQRLIISQAKQTVNEYKNLAQHTAFAIFDKEGNIAPLFTANEGKVATSLSETYTRVMDMAVQRATLGVTSYNAEMRRVVLALADSGIRTVDYATGYSRNLEAAVRQNLLWGIKHTNQNTADLVGEQFGANGYEVDYHPHPRPSHADMGGKQFSKGEGVTINGVYYPPFSNVAHLLEDYGCLHFKISVILGVSVPMYSNDELARLKENDKKEFEYEGKKYTPNEAAKTQKQLESAIKNANDRCTITKALGDKIEYLKSNQRLNNLCDKYADFSKEVELPTKAERLKAGRVSTLKKEAEINIDKIGESGIINLNRVSDPQQFKPLDIKIREQMFEGLRKNGADIITGQQAEEYLDYKSKLEKTYIEATSLGNIMLFRDNPSASAVFEETIHFNQYKRGRIMTNNLDELEIEAAEKMIKYQKAYNITDEEIVYTKKRLEILKRGE